MHDKNNDLWLLTFFAKNPHHKCSSVFQKCLLPVKKKETYLIWYYIILYTFINCPVFIDIKQTLHYKVEYWSRVLESERCLFFMHCRHMFFSHFFTGWSFAMVVLDSFFSFGRQKKWLLVVIDRWSSYTITIVWEFAWADSAVVVL